MEQDSRTRAMSVKPEKQMLKAFLIDWKYCLLKIEIFITIAFKIYR